MSRSSYKGYWADYEWSGSPPYTGLTGGQPCDTAQVWTIADNVQHLVDESPAYRINYVSPLFGDLDASAGLGTFGAYPFTALASQVQVSPFVSRARATISHEFPTTILREGEYPNYYFRMGLWLQTGTANYTATMSVRGAPAGAGLENPDVFGVMRGTTGATSGRWLNFTPDLPTLGGTPFNAFSPVWHGRKPSMSSQPFGATPPLGIVRTTQGLPAPRTKLQAFTVFVRLQVDIDATATGSGEYANFSVIGLELREFLVEGQF